MCSSFHPELPVRAMCCWMPAADAKGQRISLCMGRSRWGKLVSFFFFFKLYLDILDLTIAFFPMTSFRIEFSCKRQLLCWSTRRICFKKFIQPDKENCRCGYQREALMLLYSSWSIHKYLKGNRPAVCLQLKMLWLFFFFYLLQQKLKKFLLIIIVVFQFEIKSSILVKGETKKYVLELRSCVFFILYMASNRP